VEEHCVSFGSYEEFRKKIDRAWRNSIPKYINRDVTQKMRSYTIYAKRKEL
jgi:hypothetical protein